jgi:hypothetical protein
MIFLHRLLACVCTSKLIGKGRDKKENKHNNIWQISTAIKRKNPRKSTSPDEQNEPNKLGQRCSGSQGTQIPL